MSDFDLALNLAWLIPLFPFLAFVAIALFTYRNCKLSRELVIGGGAIAFVLSQVVFWAAVLLPVGGGDAAFESAADWFSIGISVFEASVWVDPLTAVMLLAVPLICLLVFVYSVGYMRDDPRYSRFFAYLSLLVAGMLGLVVSGNLLMLFVCWEVMGLCSYFLIGLRVEEESAYRAGLKAFLITKVGDVFLLLGLLVLYSAAGSLQYRDIFDPGTLDALACTRFLGTQFPVAAGVALLIFGGVVSQTAQFPLHVWLPDATECPPPASALIQAVTMVPAGVFLLMRCFPIFTAVEGSHLVIVAGIGAFTAIFSSLMAIAQDDIEGVLAFSTISQLGYMVAALGIGAYVAGAFHLITHAFCKALLFLASGSVIHGMKHGHHHEEEGFNPNDMRGMGGLAKRMPRTFWTFLIGGLALSGFPLVTAGFWSQSGILAQAYERSPIVFWVLAVTAGLTAFYTMRQICLTFFGQPRTEAAKHAPESVSSMTVPLIILAVFAVGLGWCGIAEDFPVIGGLIPNWFHHFIGSTVAELGFVQQPLALGLAFGLGGLALGWLVYGWKPIKAGETDRVEAAMRKVWLGWFYDAMRERFYLDEIYQATFVNGSIWLADVLDAFDYGQVEGRHGVVDWLVNLVGRFGLVLSSISNWFDVNVVDALVNLAGRAGRELSEISSLLDLRVVDRLVDLTWLGTRALSDLSGVVDLNVVDGAVNGVGDAVKAGGRFIRPIQTGRVQNYLLLVSLMVLALVVTFFVILFLAI